MVNLFIYRGYPGSGKSTEARANADLTGGVLIERDAIRHMLFGKYWGLKRRQEETVTLAQYELIKAAIGHGSNVHIADTNLRLETATGLVELGQSLGAHVIIMDIKTSANECISRDMKRKREGGRYVGSKVILDFARKYPMPWPAIVSMNYNEETAKVELVKH
jgi:predicted kinase